MTLPKEFQDRTNVLPICYSVPDAATAIGISTARLYMYMKNGALQFFKLGKRTLIRAEDLTAFLDRLPKGKLGAPPASVETVRRRRKASGSVQPA
jgi:excisionase family DNA binding protein